MQSGTLSIVHNKAACDALLSHPPCRSCVLIGGHPPSLELQVCRHCKRELAANWFAIERNKISGRRSQCRSDFTRRQLPVLARVWFTSHPAICTSSYHTRYAIDPPMHGASVHWCAVSTSKAMLQLFCRACRSENEQARASAMRNKSSVVPDRKKCRRCDEVSLIPNPHSVRGRICCPLFGIEQLASRSMLLPATACVHGWYDCLETV